MIAGIKTAAELKADADVYDLIESAPDSIGVKVMNELRQLMSWVERNPRAKEKVFTLADDIRIPTAGINYVQNIWGLILTVTHGVGKPPGYKGNIVNWSRINKISWNI